MAKVHGKCDDRFMQVENLFQSHIDSGEELGGSFVVNIDGENIIDLWGGFMDEERTREWGRDTITTMWSTTKCITALAMLILIDRGRLAPHDKISRYWPEFATNGKQDTEVRHFLSHTSGLPGWEEKLSLEDVCDLPKSTALLAHQPPWWTPGTRSGYHSFTFGHLNGELVRRTTGSSLRQFIADEIAVPLSADFQLGAVEKDWPRIAEIISPPTLNAQIPAVNHDYLAAKARESPPRDANMANTLEWMHADLGGSNGIGNARSVARILSAIALGGQVDGIQLLSPDTISLIFQEQAKGIDLVAGTKLRIGLGFGLSGKDTIADWLPDNKVCFWGGWGGSVGIVDIDKRMAISYVMNKMDDVGFGGNRSRRLVGAVYGVPQKF